MRDPATVILVVDDEELQLDMFGRALRRAGFQVVTANDIEGAKRSLTSLRIDLVLLDTYLGREPGGLQVLDYAREQPLPPVVVMMSGQAELRLAVEAMRKGAVDFLEKPIDLDELLARLNRALDTATMRRKLDVLEAAENDRTCAVAESAAMRRVLELADRVAASPASSALILGESGVGKEIVAARIHQVSKRRQGPFVRLNLAAMPESMLEADLFGSLRGAFTDSKRDRPGLLMTANGGTILLDELCEFRLELQPKLLRVLEERRFFPVGSDHERSTDVRVLAATNRNPEEAMASGRLRSDLYYRLSTVTIEIPPLRERPSDILPLARRFLEQFSATFGRRVPAQFTPRAEEALLSHHWPGNVRELRNVIERALILSDGDVISHQLLAFPRSGMHSTAPPLPPSRGSVAPSASEVTGAPVALEGLKQEALESIEREQIAKALESTGGNRTRAAEILGMSRSTLWEKMKRYKIPRKAPKR